MERTGRLTSWLRLTCALVLSLGLSSVAAATAASEGLTPRAAAGVSQVHLAAVSAVHATATRGGTELRHAVDKHRPAATASALVVAAAVLTGIATATVRRRRTDAWFSRHAFSGSARAPPVVIST
jgi:hypothetical protein